MSIFLIGILVSSFAIAISRRITSLINSFILQSLFLFFMAVFTAYKNNNIELYIVAVLILLLKVMSIPYFLRRIVKKIMIDENLGLFITPVLSIFAVIMFAYFSYYLSVKIIGIRNIPEAVSLAVSLMIILTGLFIMVFRMKAIAQVVGLLVIENGLFLVAVTLCGHMPFFVEIAIFFDVFVCVIILGVFVYKINELFTHIDVDKLTMLKG